VVVLAHQEPVPEQGVVVLAHQEPVPEQGVVVLAHQEPVPEQGVVVLAYQEPVPEQGDVWLYWHIKNPFTCKATCGCTGTSRTRTRARRDPSKAWLCWHIKNPYPSKAEKLTLAIIAKMSLTQVSTWFANARRRLKKDNRRTCWPSARDRRHTDTDADEDDGGDGGDDTVVMATGLDRSGLVRCDDVNPEVSISVGKRQRWLYYYYNVSKMSVFFLAVTLTNTNRF